MNSTSINLYICKIETENAKLKTLVEDKIAVIERLDAEIIKLHQKLDVLPDDDCESEVGSCDEPIYEFDTDTESEPPQMVRRTLSPHSDSDSDTDTDTDVDSYIEYPNDDLYDALMKVIDNEDNEHKKLTFKKAADIIYNLPFEIKSGSEISNGPNKISGIGKTIASMIDEFIATGKIIRGESTNHKLAAAFDKLATLVSHQEFKCRAYKNAAQIVRSFSVPITSGKKLSEGPHKVNGIVKSIGRMIDEFLTTGQIRKIQEVGN